MKPYPPLEELSDGELDDKLEELRRKAASCLMRINDIKNQLVNAELDAEGRSYDLRDAEAEFDRRHKSEGVWPPALGADIEHIANWDVGTVIMADSDGVVTSNEYSLSRMTFGDQWRIVDKSEGAA